MGADIGIHWPLRSLRLDDRRVESSAKRTRAANVFLDRGLDYGKATLDSDVPSRMLRDPAEMPGQRKTGVPGPSLQGCGPLAVFDNNE